MNQKKRKTLASSIAAIQSGMECVQQASQLVDDVLDDERECYENMPESFQDSGRGCSMSDAIDRLEEASDSLHEVLTMLEEAESNLDEAGSSR